MGVLEYFKVVNWLHVCVGQLVSSHLRQCLGDGVKCIHNTGVLHDCLAIN